ncbi:hypothetical protein N9V43_00440 [Flavobacteriales bacterium]|nr:hypothetical protein [Flavobacteriales bacterium]
MKNAALLLLIVCSIYNTSIFCQSAGQDITICKGESPQLNTSNFDYTQWNPSAY